MEIGTFYINGEFVSKGYEKIALINPTEEDGTPLLLAMK